MSLLWNENYWPTLQLLQRKLPYTQRLSTQWLLLTNSPTVGLDPHEISQHHLKTELTNKHHQVTELLFFIFFIIKRSGDFHISRALCTGNSSMAFTQPEFSRGEVMEWPGKLEQGNKAPWPDGIHLGLPVGKLVSICTAGKPGVCCRPPRSLKSVFKIEDVINCTPLVQDVLPWAMPWS